MDYSPPDSVLHYVLEFAHIHIQWVVDAICLILCCPHLLLPSVFPSIKFFSSELTLWIRWPKCWSFRFNNSPSSSGLISFRIGWFDLLAVQVTVKSLLQHHSSKASVLQCSAFFVVQVSHLYMTTGKTIALAIWTFVGKVMSLLFNTYLPCWLKRMTETKSCDKLKHFMRCLYVIIVLEILAIDWSTAMNSHQNA